MLTAIWFESVINSDQWSCLVQLCPPSAGALSLPRFPGYVNILERCNPGVKAPDAGQRMESYERRRGAWHEPAPVRSIVAIRDQGGVRIPGGGSLRIRFWLGNGKKLEALRQAHGISRWSTDVAACLANADDSIY